MVSCNLISSFRSIGHTARYEDIENQTLDGGSIDYASKVQPTKYEKDFNKYYEKFFNGKTGSGTCVLDAEIISCAKHPNTARCKSRRSKQPTL